MSFVKKNTDMVADIADVFDRDAQFAAKRRAVILSAAAAFRRRGYHNTSMVDIAKVLGLTKAALYYYVKNKEEILYECHILSYDAMDEILKRPPLKGQTALDHLELLYLECVKLLTQSGISLLTDVDSLSGPSKQNVLKRRGKIEKNIIRLVKQGQQDGSIRAGDARMHVFFFMGALNWLNAWYEGAGRMKSDDIAIHFAMQMRRSIAA